MSILVIGVNHRSSPVSLLERLTLAPERLGKAVAGLAVRDNIREAVVLSTCNRTEVYVVAELFHGAYGDVRDFLCEISDLSVDELTPHLYSQHDTAATIASRTYCTRPATQTIGSLRIPMRSVSRSGVAMRGSMTTVPSRA